MMEERTHAFKKCKGKETRSSQTDILWNRTKPNDALHCPGSELGRDRLTSGVSDKRA